MAIIIHKYKEYVPWDAQGVGVVKHGRSPGGCDLSNYYTIDQLVEYGQARIHYSNIFYDGLGIPGPIHGESVVTGWLGTATSGRLRGDINGTSTVTGILPFQIGMSVTFAMSIEQDSNDVVSLVGDEELPGINKMYATNNAGHKGWYDVPTGGTPTAHGLTSTFHTESGLTEGHFLKATGVNTFGWQPHGLTPSDIGASSAVHNHDGTYVNIVTSPTVGNFPTLTSSGQLTNSAYGPNDFSLSDHNHDSDYVSIVTSVTPGNIPSFDSGGELEDSGYSFSDFSISTHDHDGSYISIVSTPTVGNFPVLNASGELVNSTYGPSSFSPSNHNHNTLYEPIISKSIGYAVWDGSAWTWRNEAYSLTTHHHDSNYISIISSPTAGNFPVLASTGELNNSTYGPSSFASASHTHTRMVDYTGTPANNYIAVFTDTDTITGTSGLTWNGTTLNISGAVTATGVMTASNFCQSSDQILKTNIKDYVPKPLDIRYREYEMKADPGKIRYGVIAQEILEKYPQFVRKDPCSDLLYVTYIDLIIAEIAYLKDEVKVLKRLLKEKNGNNRRFGSLLGIN